MDANKFLISVDLRGEWSTLIARESMIAQTEQSFVDLQLIRLHDINNINIILDHTRSCLASPRQWFDIVFIHKIQTAPQRQIKRFEKFCCRPVDEPVTVRSCVLNLKSREYSTRSTKEAYRLLFRTESVSSRERRSKFFPDRRRQRRRRGTLVL